MSNNPREFVWDTCLDEQPSSTPKKIKSLTNEKYRANLVFVRRVISKNNTRYQAERKKVASLIIKDINTDNGYEQILECINPSTDKKQRKVLEAALTLSFEKIAESSRDIKEIHLKNTGNAKSIKGYNIIFNLSHCLEKISESFAKENIFDNKYLSYLLGVLWFIKNAIKVCTINLTELDAVLISCIYSFKKAPTIEMIWQRLEASDLISKYQLTDIDVLTNKIETLKKLKIVTDNNGEYSLIEEVIL